MDVSGDNAMAARGRRPSVNLVGGRLFGGREGSRRSLLLASIRVRSNGPETVVVKRHRPGRFTDFICGLCGSDAVGEWGRGVCWRLWLSFELWGFLRVDSAVVRSHRSLIPVHWVSTGFLFLSFSLQILTAIFVHYFTTRFVVYLCSVLIGLTWGRCVVTCAAPPSSSCHHLITGNGHDRPPSMVGSTCWWPTCPRPCKRFRYPPRIGPVRGRSVSRLPGVLFFGSDREPIQPTNGVRTKMNRGGRIVNWPTTSTIETFRFLLFIFASLLFFLTFPLSLLWFRPFRDDTQRKICRNSIRPSLSAVYFRNY